MDYLVIEGYKSAAEEFSKEADIAPPVDFESIASRMDIREAVQRGDIEEAIERVNDLNPEVRPFSIRVFSFATALEKGLSILAPLSDSRVGDETQHHTFSLQYDYTPSYL